VRTYVRVYTELHCHSAFSFLDGASLPDEIVAVAVELGYSALALTDHNSVSGSMEFAMAARALGLRAIHGAEIDLDDGRHLTLLVENAKGWSNLCRILTQAHSHTRDGRPGAPPAQPETPIETVLHHAAGLVCLSGCALRGVHGNDVGRLHAEELIMRVVADSELYGRRVGTSRVDKRNSGLAGSNPYEIAETKVTQVMDFARKHQHPLQCVMEKK